MEEKPKDVRLSYSSASLLQSCSQKYYFHKIAGVAKDTDTLEDEKAFNVGKVFHFVMEKTHHSRTDDIGELLKHACKEFDVENEMPMLHGMILKYLETHKLSGLKCAKTEFEMSNDNFIGYIDAILWDENTGEWWVCDLKTAASFSEITAAQLHDDTQLNLYSYFAEDMARQFSYDPTKFRGCRYRVTTKSKLKQKEKENYAQFVGRCYEAVKSYDVIVPIETMCPPKAMARHLRLFAESLKLRDGTAQPLQNFGACGTYFKPCQFWSQCHGSTFTECKARVKILGGE